MTLTRRVERVLYDEVSERWRVVSDTGALLAVFLSEWQAWQWVDAAAARREGESM